jgi:hypothetical protein
MSSFSENPILGSDFLPPESAQLPQSLFGGPSSDVGLQPSSQPELPKSSLFTGPFLQNATLDPVPESEPMDEAPDALEDEYHTIMRERSLAPDSDADSFYGGERRGRRRSRRNQSSEPVQYFEPAESSQVTMTLPSEPIQYIIDRGLDLAPGTERPNLFEGAANSWRNYNADDIGAYDAMVTNRSRDLGIHLYNAHALRRRMDDTLRKDPNVDKDTLPEMRKRWTAWPVRAAKVPRVDETFRNYMNHAGNIHMQADTRPSANLEESISTVMLKNAKDKYRAREWDYEDIKSDLDEKVNDEDQMVTEDPENKKYLGPIYSTVMRPIVQLDDDKSLRQLRPLARNVITQVDKLLYGLHCAMKGRKFEENSDDNDAEDEDEDSEEDEDEDSEEAVMEGKDDHNQDKDEGEEYVHSPRRKRNSSQSLSRGRNRLRTGSPQNQPLSRSVCAREGEGGEGEEEPSTRKKRNGSRSLSRGHKRLRTGSPQNQPPSRSASTRASKEPETEYESLSDTSQDSNWSYDSGQSGDVNYNIKGKQKLRDWSEMLGLAAIMDISSTAVMRASKRCADLFGEDMEFHTMAEGRVKKRRNKDGQWEYAYTESETDSEDEPCPPTPQPKSPSKSRAKPKTPTQKRSKKHKTPAIVPQSGSSSPAPEPAAKTPEPPVRKEPKKLRPGLGKGAHRKADIVCPFEDCNRHTKGFSRTWNLNQHLKKAHPSYVAPRVEASNARDIGTPEADGVIEVD